MSAENERRLILHVGVSMDGFVNGRDGQIDWHEPSGEDAVDNGAQRHRMNLELESQIDLIVIGTGAYQEFERGWSTSDSPMGKFMNGVRKLVFTQSLDEVGWSNSVIAERALSEEIPRLKREEGLDMVCFGGGRIAHSLIRERLVDELRLTIHPVMLGEGLSIMHGLPEPQRFQMVSSTVYADGSLSQVLRPI